MKTILLTNTYKEQALEILQDLIPSDYRLLVLPQATQETLSEYAKEADYLLVSGRLKIDVEVLNRASKLRMIQRTGVGLDNMDLDEIKKRNIPLYVNKGVNADSVAEHTIMLMLASLRNLLINNNNVKNNIWIKQAQGLRTHELQGKTVGIIGLGTIGKRVAEILTVFGAEVVYFNKRSKGDCLVNGRIIRYMELNDLLKCADIISLHCPLTEETKGFICNDTIKLMKKGVVIINTARGKLIKVDDFRQALADKTIGAAGLDVFWDEPPKAEEVYDDFDNVIVTPHIGGVTYEAFRTMMESAIRNIILFDQNELAEIKKHRLV